MISKSTYAALVFAALIVAPTAFAADHFEMQRGITDGSPYPVMQSEYVGAQGKRMPVEAEAPDHFSRHVGISDGSPFPLRADEGVQGRRGSVSQPNPWLERQLRISDGSSE